RPAPSAPPSPCSAPPRPSGVSPKAASCCGPASSPSPSAPSPSTGPQTDPRAPPTIDSETTPVQHTDQTTQPLTGNLVPATYEPTQGSAWTMPGPRLDIDLDTALTLLTDSEVERIVAQATAEVHGPQLSTTPQHTPGTIKAYVPGMEIG